MKKKHSTTNRWLCLLLCAAILIGLFPLGSVVANESYTGVIADKDKGYGPGTVHALPGGIDDEQFLKTYVYNGGKLSLNSKFQLVASQNYDGAGDRLPAGTMEGDRNAKWWASYKLNLTDEELAFLNSNCSFDFRTNMISDEHSHGLFKKRWHWSTAGIALSGPNEDGSNSWVYGTNGRFGDPGYIRVFSDLSDEKLDGEPQSTGKYMREIPYDGNLFLNAYQLWNRDCGNARLSGTVLYASIGNTPYVSEAGIYTINGGTVKTLSSLAEENTQMLLKLEMNTKIRFADNMPRDLSKMKIYMNAEYLEQSDYNGSFRIEATFDHMTEDALYFKFNLKKSWKHFKITGVDGDDCGFNKETNLVVWGADGKTLDAVKLTSETLFSDFYGNPMGIFYGEEFYTYRGNRTEYVFDCVSPELTKLDMSGNGVPTNASTPEDWNSNSGSKSDVFAGTDGDTYTFRAYFTENVSVANRDNARAVLSITKNAEPIKLRVSKVSGNCVTFESITVTEDMLSPGEQIYIEKLENFVVKDQVGNSLGLTTILKPAQQVLLDVDRPYTDTTHIPDGDDIYTAFADGAEAWRFSFPVKFQDVTASGVRNSGIAGTDMTFKLEMADGTLDLPYRWYMDTNQTIKTGARWQPGVTGGEITFTDLAENQLYWIHIELYESVDYHYSRNEKGIWFNGKLTFDGLRDWAGNTTVSRSYSLRHQVDQEGPAIEFVSKVGMQYSFLDNSDVDLSFNVKFRAMDNFALNSLYYQWEIADENGSFTPVGDGFTRIDVSKDTLNREEIGTASHELTVDSENRGKIRVKVYAVDQLGFTSEVITSEPVSWVFGGIQNLSTVTENDALTPVKLPEFDMNAPVTEGTTGNTPAALLVIPDVNSRNAAGEYTQFWIWGTKSWYDGYSPLSQYIKWYESGYFTYDAVNGYLGKVTGHIDVETAEGIFTEMLQLNIQSDEQTEELLAARKEFYDYLTTYNGSMELYTVATYSIAEEFEDVQFLSSQSALNTYEVYILNSTDYQVDWTIVNAEGKTDAQSAAAGGVKLDYEPGQGAYPATNLDNVSVTVKITNITDPANKNGVKYGLEFLDYAEGNAAFELYYLESSHYNQNNSYEDIHRYYDHTPIKTWDLVKSADGTNTIVFEPGLCKDNGYYTLAFVYTDTYTGETEKQVLGAFYMDSTTLDITIGDYHKALEWENDGDDYSEEAFVWTLSGIADKYANGEDIRLGLAPLPEGWSYGQVYDDVSEDWVEGSELTFTTTRRPSGDTANSITDDLAAFRVYNVTYNAQAGLARDASAGWKSTTDTPGSDIRHAYLPYLADVNAQTPYGTVDGNEMLPFVDGTNLLVYEIKASNGVVSSHEIVIHVEGEAADWKLDYEVSYNADTGKPIGITVRPVDADGFPLDLNGSEDTDNVEVYNQNKYNFREYKSSNVDFAAEYHYGKSVVDQGYVMIDPMGNISERTLTVYDTDGVTPLFIDSREPAYSQFYLCTDETCKEGHLPMDVEKHCNMDTFHMMIDSTDDSGGNGSGIDPNSFWLIFDAEYSKLLDGEKDEAGRVVMELPLARDENGDLLMNEDGTYAVWEDLQNPVNGIYRTQIRENTGNVVAIAIWGLWKASDDPEVNVTYPNIAISTADMYGNRQSYGGYYDDYKEFSPSVIMNGYSFGVGSLAYNVGREDPYTGEMVIAETTILENAPDSEGVIGIYSTVPFLNVSGWGVDADDMVEVVVDVDADPPFNDYDGKDYVPAGRYYFYPAPMITQDGTYYFSVTDLFGEVYDQEPGTVEEGDTMLHEQIPVDVHVFGDTGIHVSFSTTEPTNGSVTVFADCTGYYESISSITASNGTVGTIDPVNPSAAHITVEENCVITIETDGGSSRNVKVTNIDKVLEPASIVFYDQNYDLLNPAYGATEVTAVLRCDEHVITTNGPDTYVFPAGSKAGDTYTFEYQDMAGNTGTITATLPMDLSEAEMPEEDTSAPDLDASLYGYRMNAYRLVTQLRNPDMLDGESELTAELNADGSYKAQKYRLAMKVSDESAVKILVTAAGTAAPADYASVETGCTVSGVTMVPGKNAATLEITENVTFDVHLIDEKNNVASFPGVRIVSIDTNAPVLVPVYEYGVDEKGSAVVVATFEPEEADKFEQITPMSADVQSRTVQVGTDDAGNPIYALRYCYTFTGNGSYTFTYQDSIGNIGTAAAEVRGMSNEAAVVQSIAWYGTAPAGHTGVSPDRSTHVNRDITAQLEMNKAISAAELYEYDPQAEDQIGKPLRADAPVTLDFTATTINITYSENVDYRIVVRFTASASGRKGTYVLPVVGCIDKTMPQVTLKSGTLAEDKRSMTFIFETSKPTVLSQDLTGDNTGAFRTVHSLTVTDDTPVMLYFVDRVGNQIVYELNDFSGLDTLRLAVSYSRDAAGTGETQDPLGDLELFGGSSFFVRVNKAATVTVDGGAAITLAANAWTEFTTPAEPGFHFLKFTDINTGDTLTELVRALPKDNLAPVMEFASSTVLIWQNEPAEKMMNAIREGVTVTDNADSAVDFTVTGYPDSTAETGLFTLRYTAQDSSGNRISAERSLYIVGEDTPILRINGEAGLPYSTAFLSSGEITLELENSEKFADQPVIIKFRKGLYTTGQMKYYATTVENMEFGITERGHYTIYVRAQDRTEFVTYIYLEG
ncbi:MAG: hypothetical protein IKB09_02965 [Oscillospiraceae bacterium]|nr:hypothetical protein [Oscillospiraceae bacterium]